MYGGGIDKDLPWHLETAIISIPSLDESDFIAKLKPAISARVVLVVEKDTLFSKLV